MTYIDLYEKAISDLEHNKINLGEFEKRIAPLQEKVREKGRWVHWTDDRKDYCKCSVCSYGEEGEVLLGHGTNYCPICGSEMGEE